MLNIKELNNYMTTYTQHEIGKCNPKLQEWEYADLQRDILAAKEVRQPIVIYEGKILDGWHRYNIAISSSLDFKTETYTGNSPASFVKSTTTGRNLTQIQRSAVLDDLEPWILKEVKTFTKGSHQPEGKKGFQKVEGSLRQQEKQNGIDHKVRSRTLALKEKDPVLHTKVKDGEMTYADANRELGKREHAKKVEHAAANPQKETYKGPYDLILADPCWKYHEDDADYSRNVDNHYNTATAEEICKHSKHVNGKDNSILFLWATATKLPEALQVMEAWGYKYITHAIWDKQILGMGHWFRIQHELLLVGTKGKVRCPIPSQRAISLFTEKRTEHSKKPECVYKWIESTFPDLNKLEMYCRTPRKGWSSWGNEV